MENKHCCAYNVSRSCRLSSNVAEVNCAGDPFKLMKILLDGLAQNADACFWLTHLTHCPQIVRIFPFDFAYLDRNNNIIQAVELPPGIPLPAFHPHATSALILPFNSTSRTTTVEGDQLIICSAEELESLLSEPGPQPAILNVPQREQLPNSSGASRSAPPTETPVSFFRQAAPVSVHSIPHGATFTAAVASSWQLANSTAVAMLLEPPEAADSDTPVSNDAASGVVLLEPMELELQNDDLTSDQYAPSDSLAQSTEMPVCDDSPLVLIPENSNSEEEPLADSESSGFPVTTAESASITPPEVPAPASDELVHTPSDDAPPAAGLAITEAEPESPDNLEDLSTPSRHFSFDAELAIRRQKALDARIARSKAAAGNHHVKTAPKAKQKPEPQKDNLGSRVIRWLALDAPQPERRKIIRLLLGGLRAYRADMDGAKRYEVRDICPPSFYLHTSESWQEGDLIQLGFETAGARNDEQRVRFWTRVVRADEDGFGLEFMLPPGTDFQPWKRVNTKRSDETEAEYIVRELRFCRALGFLQSLSPVASAEISHALLDRLSNKRVESAIAIALMCELALEKNADLGKVRADSEIIIRIIESGSWIEESWIRKLWAGMLASSCSGDGHDRSNLLFIDMLARLTPIHLRIFSHACKKASEAIAAGASESTLDLYSETRELMEVADTHSFPRIQQTIGHLASYGLLADISRPSYVAMSDKAKTKTTPTALGLKIYSRCNGQRP
jgi:hypothetical protein